MVIFAIGAALISTRQAPIQPGGHSPTDQLLAERPLVVPRADASIANANQLATESAALKAEGDALEKWIAARERAERIAALEAEQDRLIVATSAPDPVIVAIDRAAGSAVCQADFLWQTLGDRSAAENAYRNVVEQFPDTALGDDRSGQLDSTPDELNHQETSEIYYANHNINSACACGLPDFSCRGPR